MDILKHLRHPLQLPRKIYNRLYGNRLSVQLRYFMGYDRKRVFYTLKAGKRLRERHLAEIIMEYHIVEKGLTMPNRRFNFGHAVILKLTRSILAFHKNFGTDDPQVTHAIGVLRAYDEMHKDFDRSAEPEFWKTLTDFLARFPDVPAATQAHMTRKDFYASNEAPFPAFAAARHTLRHYAGPLNIEKIRKAVALAQTAPSACNRQHARVYCVSDPTLREQVLDLQNGNRGFGHLSDKLLVVTSDLADLCGTYERNDAFINGGIFLMTLCNALHYYEVAHCILNWSVVPTTDKAIRELLPLSSSELVIAILSCGEAPEEFDIATSPRKPLEAIYREL